jgi:medium-chain acyl-[acyl-carrier-protein] hydrolase
VARLRLFCLPYAGGGANTYRLWPQLLPDEVELCVFQLPGRGARLSDAPFTDSSPLVSNLYDVIEPYLDMPVAFFGHSMGALLAFELARRLRQKSKPEPAHLFLSGRRAAQIPLDGPPIYNLPEAELVEKLRELKGTPKEVFEYPELLQLMIPLLQADFAVCQSYVYSPEPPLNCPITVLGGAEDQEIGRDLLEAWSAQTTSTFYLHMFPGDHFFINTTHAPICRLISNQLGYAV